MKHLYESVAEDVAARIDWGIYRSGERLPGVRSLSRQFNVSLSTVQAAYRLLEDQGKIQARARSGHYVTSQRRQTVTQPDMAYPPATPTPVTGQTLTRQILSAAKDPFQINLGSSVPHPDLLPTRILQQATAKVVRTQGKSCSDTEELLGNPELRRQIAKRMAALNCHVIVDDIVITYGARDSVRLALKAVCQPGDVVAIESPTFYGLLQVIESCGLQALEIPTHPRYGMSLDALQLAVDQWPVKACLVIANFNNPLGSCMPDDLKRALLALLTSRGIPLIEDDVYGDLAFGSVRPSILMSHNQEADVLYCSSFAKTLSPGLRVGWLVSGHRHKEKVESLKYLQHEAAPTLNQLVVAHVLGQGGYARYLRQIRQVYASNVSRTTEAICTSFPEEVRITQPEGGFALWVEMPAGVDAMELHRRAGLAGITIAPGPLFSATQKKYGNFIRLNCAVPWSDRVESAFKKLGDLIRTLMLD